MRTLSVLIVIQLVATAFLYTRLVSIEARLDAPQAADAPLASTPPAVVADAMPGGRYAPADERLLRAILREELAVYAEDFARHEAAPVQAAARSGSYPDADARERRDRVAERLDYFVSVGRITEAEMQQLQLEIARLDPDGRQEMLRKLGKVLNSGDVEGRL